MEAIVDGFRKSGKAVTTYARSVGVQPNSLQRWIQRQEAGEPMSHWGVSVPGSEQAINPNTEKIAGQIVEDADLPQHRPQRQLELTRQPRHQRQLELADTQRRTDTEQLRYEIERLTAEVERLKKINDALKTALGALAASS